MRSYLKEKVAAPVKKTEIIGRGGSAALTNATPLYTQKLTLKFADQWRSISWYSSLTD
jgi:hypothetical protein